MFGSLGVVDVAKFMLIFNGKLGCAENGRNFGLYGPFWESISLSGVALLKKAISMEKQCAWHMRSGRRQWRTGGCTMSGFKGRERETASWGQTEKIRGFCSGGHGLACADRLWWMPVLIATVLVTSILLEQCYWLWSSHQPVHPKGSIFSWLVHFLPTHLFTFKYQILCFPLTTGKRLLHLWGL